MLAVLAALLCLCVSPTYGSLFEDQKGSTSWHLENVGEPVAGQLLRKSPAAVLSTQADVLASIALRDGALRWRRQQRAEHVVVLEPREMVVAADGDILSAWSSQAGQLLWSAQAPAVAVCASSQAVYTVAQHDVTAWSAGSGRKLWSAPVNGAPAGWCSVQENQVHVVTWSEAATTLHSTYVSLSDGSVQTEQAAQCGVKLGKLASYRSALLAVSSQDHQQVCSIPPGSGAAACACAAVPDGGQLTSISAAGQYVAGLTAAGALHTFSVADGALRHAATVHSAAAASDMFADGARSFVAVAQAIDLAQPHALALRVCDAATGAADASDDIRGFSGADANGAVAQPRKLWAVRATSATSAPFFR